MAISLTPAGALEKIEQQKQLALQTPILVIASPPATEALRPITDGFSEIYGSKSYFSFSSPENAEQALASAIPRTMVLYFYRPDSIYQEPWLRSAIAPGLAGLPDVDLYAIDVTPSTLSDPILVRLGVEKLPTVLIYKMGHQIEKILPETQNQTVAAQVSTYLGTISGGPKPELDPLRAKLSDLDHAEFEQRMREKQLEEQRKEQKQKIRERADVLKKIAEDKAARQGK
jgi:hypothetical protein